MRKNIMLCTLGASWAVVPEIYGFISHKTLPLYQHHPDARRLEKLRKDYALQTVDEIWVCTTQGKKTEESIQQLRSWLALISEPPVLRIWQAQHTDELATQAECRHIQELIMRTIMLAHDHTSGGQLSLSLAGGRKTMSADMQWGASVFGCQALLHVIGANNMPEPLKQALPETFTQPLAKEICQAISPLISCQTQRSELLDIEIDNIQVSTTQFPLPLASPTDNYKWPVPDNWLTDEILKREKAGSRLLGNYFFDLSRAENHENWRTLYRLSPRLIDQLRHTPLGPEHATLLQKLPKADLHRHLGGCLDLSAQRRVGQAIWENMTAYQQRSALNQIKRLFDIKLNIWPENWAKTLKTQPDKAYLAAAILIHADENILKNNLWHVTEPRIALKQKSFSLYEQPGELTGSTVLGEPSALEAYTQSLVQQATDEGLAYVELRGSPQKYGTDGLKFLENFYQALRACLSNAPQKPVFRFIIIADRRNLKQLETTITLAVEAHRRWPDFVVGVDLAGDESEPLPANIQQIFSPAFEQCLPITIHAGEGENAQSIWNAAYKLHADRIGHGLTLHDNELLATRFRNRGICLELCPTSNIEVVGYCDPENHNTHKYPHYPLLELWNSGMPLTLCTDNPGISRTTLANEYLLAARMSEKQLMLWDMLAMIKQGFVHGFINFDDKTTLIKQCDEKIYQLMLEFER